PASPMTPLVANLSDQDLRDLAAFYARPATPATGQPGLVSSTGAGPLDAGERLYRSGDPGRGIPPCQGCHGIDGSGHPLADAPGAAGRYRTYPALQGQWADFLVMNLTAYRDGSLADSTNDFVMTGAAR